MNRVKKKGISYIREEKFMNFFFSSTNSKESINLSSNVKNKFKFTPQISL